MLLVGCVEPEILEPRDGTVPVNVDLSGNWVLRNDRREDSARLLEAVRNTDGIDEADIFRPPSRPSNGSRNSRIKGGLVDVFLEVGESLKITQTDHALFISFDRAVVEEFRFGEYRIVNVGPIQAQRTTGWEGNQLVVETLDKNRMKLIDRFELVDAGATLERSITFRSEEGTTESIVQRFDRRD